MAKVKAQQETFKIWKGTENLSENQLSLMNTSKEDVLWADFVEVQLHNLHLLNQAYLMNGRFEKAKIPKALFSKFVRIC